MKFIVFAIVVLVGVAQAKIDWSKVKAKHLTVNPIRTVAQPRIVGGQEAEPNSIPYQVAVVSEWGTFCGGSIISPLAILTAAHCVDDAVAATIITGAHKIEDEEEDTRQVIESKRVIVHVYWEPFNLRNDLAIIKLKKPIQLDSTAKIVQLNIENSTLEGEEALVSGWGRPSDSTGSLSPVLRYVTEEIIPNTLCGEDYNGFITPKHLCLDGAHGKGSCNGDSGGPLVVHRDGEPVQAGIVSFGSATGCATGYPSVYTRVSDHIDWIQENMV